GLAARDERARLLVVALWVHLEDVRDLHRERRVHVNGDLRDETLHAKALDREDDLLRALERERRHDELAAAIVDALHERNERFVHRLERRVKAIAVRALPDERR